MTRGGKGRKQKSAFSNLAGARKGQTEIMGLAIIMILAILGLLFVVKFILSKPDSESELRQSQQESQLAANIINAFLETTLTDCENNQIKTLLQDCARATPTIWCGSRSSCQVVNDSIKYVLQNTLEAWNRDFNFTVSGLPSSADIGYGKGDCTGQVESKFSPIQAAGRTIIVKLEICN